MKTAEEITNLYLYGTSTTPSNLADESLICPNNTRNMTLIKPVINPFI